MTKQDDIEEKYRYFIDGEIQKLLNEYKLKKENLIILGKTDDIELKNLPHDELLNRLKNRLNEKNKILNDNNTFNYYKYYLDIWIDIFEQEILRRRKEKIIKILKRLKKT